MPCEFVDSAAGKAEVRCDLTDGEQAIILGLWLTVAAARGDQQPGRQGALEGGEVDQEGWDLALLDLRHHSARVSEVEELFNHNRYLSRQIPLASDSRLPHAYLASMIISRLFSCSPP